MRKLFLLLFLFNISLIVGCGGGDEPAPVDTPAPVPEMGDPAAPPEAGSETASTDSSATLPNTAETTGKVPVGSSLNYLGDDTVIAIFARPSSVLGTNIVRDTLQMIHEVDPETNPTEQLSAMKEQFGVEPQQVDHVLLAVNQEQLQMLPMLMMMGGMGAGGEVEFEGLENEEFEFENLPDDEFSPDNENIDIQPDSAASDAESFFQPADDPFADNEFAGDDFSGGFPEPSPPLIVVQLVDGVNVQAIMDSVPDGEEFNFDQGKAMTGPNGTFLFQQNPSRLLISSKKNVEAALALESSGRLADVLSPLAETDLAIAVNIKPLLGMLQEGVGQEGNFLIGMAMALLGQMDMVTISADLDAETLVQVQINAVSEDAANALNQSLSQYVAMGRQQYAENTKDAPVSPELKAMGDSMVNDAKLTVSGDVLTLAVPRPQNFDQLPALLKPAVIEARAAAKSMSKMNDLKQIGLAMHNYHDVWNHFPAVDSNGEKENAEGKGLSWRVHLLPYLDHAYLYEQFNLDEPWDSEYNKSLIEQMPAVFGEHPEGKTTLHVFVGEKTLFQAGQPGPPIRDFIDGLSNTALVVKAGEDKAEIWTKPGGLELNTENPVSALGNVGEEFLILFADGSVRTLPADIEKETLLNLIQHNDGNTIELP